MHISILHGYRRQDVNAGFLYWTKIKSKNMGRTVELFLYIWWFWSCWVAQPVIYMIENGFIGIATKLIHVIIWQGYNRHHILAWIFQWMEIKSKIYGKRRLAVFVRMFLTQVIRITQMTWLYGFVLQCLVSSSMDFCPAVSVESKYRQWSRSHARAWDSSLFHSRISLVSFMITRSVRALEDHVAWSSRTSLVTLMSGARASSWCLCIGHALASVGHTHVSESCFIDCSVFLVSSFCCSSVSV